MKGVIEQIEIDVWSLSITSTSCTGRNSKETVKGPSPFASFEGLDSMEALTLSIVLSLLEYILEAQPALWGLFSTTI